MTLKIFHSKPSQSLKRSLVSRASVSMKFISLHFSVFFCFLFLFSFFLGLYINKQCSFPCISVPFCHWWKSKMWIMKKFDDGRVCLLCFLEF